MSAEEWRDVPGYEGRYQVSDQGRVRSFKRGRDGYVMQPTVLTSGYAQVQLIQPDGSPVRFRVHRLVALEFIANPKQLPDVNHLDGVKLNNAASNLEWVTALDNQRHAAALGLTAKGERNGRAVLSRAEAVTIRTAYAQGYSGPALADMFGVHRNTIYNIVRGRQWRHA